MELQDNQASSTVKTPPLASLLTEDFRLVKLKGQIQVCKFVPLNGAVLVQQMHIPPEVLKTFVEQTEPLDLDGIFGVAPDDPSTSFIIQFAVTEGNQAIQEKEAVNEVKEIESQPGFEEIFGFNEQHHEIGQRVGMEETVKIDQNWQFMEVPEAENEAERKGKAEGEEGAANEEKINGEEVSQGEGPSKAVKDKAVAQETVEINEHEEVKRAEDPQEEGESSKGPANEPASENQGDIPVKIPASLLANAEIKVHEFKKDRPGFRFIEMEHGKICLEHSTFSPHGLWHNHVFNRHSLVFHCPGCYTAFDSPNTLNGHISVCNTTQPKGTEENEQQEKFKCFADPVNCPYLCVKAEHMAEHLELIHPEYDVDDFRSKFLPLSAKKRRNNSGQVKDAPKPKRSKTTSKGSFDPEDVSKAVQHALTSRFTSSTSRNCRMSKSDAVTLVSVLSVNDKVEILDASSSPENFNFPRANRIELADFGVVRSFPAFTAFMVKAELLGKGGVVVKPPSNFKPSLDPAELTEKLKSIYIQRTTSFTIASASHNRDAFRLTANTFFKGEKHYSVYDHLEAEWDPDAMDMMAEERNFFNSLVHNKEFAEVIIGVDASLFKNAVDGWNLRNLQDDLHDPFVFGRQTAEGLKSLELKGVTRPELQVGRKFSIIPLQKDENDLGQIFYHHTGAPRVIYAIHPKHTQDFEKKMSSRKVGCFDKNCSAFLRHKLTYVRPAKLSMWSIHYSKLVLNSGEFLVVSPGTYIFGYDLGSNVIETTRFHTREVFPYLKGAYYRCFCNPAPLQFLPLDGAIQKYESESYALFQNGNLTTGHPHAKDQDRPVQNELQLRLSYRVQNQKKAGVDAAIASPYWMMEDGNVFN